MKRANGEGGGKRLQEGKKNKKKIAGKSAPNQCAGGLKSISLPSVESRQKEPGIESRSWKKTARGTGKAFPYPDEQGRTLPENVKGSLNSGKIRRRKIVRGRRPHALSITARNEQIEAGLRTV